MARLLPHIIVLAVCAMVMWGCGPSGQSLLDDPEIRFIHQGVEIGFSAPVLVQSVSVLDSANRVLFKQRIRDGQRRSLSIPLRWEHNTTYSIQIRTEQGRITTDIRSPEGAHTGAAVHFALPYSGREEPFSLEGLSPEGEFHFSATYGSTITGGLTVRHYGGSPATYDVAIDIPETLELLEFPSEAAVSRESGRTTLRSRMALQASNQLRYLVFRVKLNSSDPIMCRTRVIRRDGTGESVYQRIVRLSPVSMDTVREQVEIGAIHMPTSSKGLFDTKNQPDTLFFGPKFFRLLGKLLGTDKSPKNNWTPYTYQTVRLKNTGDAALSVLVSSRITAQGKDTAPDAFLPPDRFSGKLKDQSLAVTATLAPGSTTTVILPVYIHTVPNPGTYDREIKVYPMGNNLPVHEVELPLYVTTTDVTAVSVVLGSLVLSLCGVVFFCFKFKALIKSMPVQHLVVISFFGAVTFAGINVPLKIFNSVISAMFGPFAVLVLGFFNDLIYFSMLIALLRLIPRPGVVTLAFLVRYFLAGMMLGGFHVLDFLYMGTSLVLKEGALYACGITRKQEAFEWTYFSTLVTALLLGAADALINASSVYLHVIFYRLYFADWYIFLSILFNGFVYTGIGVYFGKRFSNTLKMVQE